MRVELSRRALKFLGRCSEETARRLSRAFQELESESLPIEASPTIPSYGYVFLGDYTLGITVDVERDRVVIQKIGRSPSREPF